MYDRAKSILLFFIAVIMSWFVIASIDYYKNVGSAVKSTSESDTIKEKQIENKATDNKATSAKTTSSTQMLNTSRTRVASTTTMTTTTKTTTTTTKKKSTTTKKKETTTTKSKSVFYLSDKERRVVECIVMGEAGGESYKGQVLVAQCILNACLKDNTQPSKVRTKYQYSGWNKNPSKSVKKAVSAVFDNGYKITNEPILYFYSPKYCKSSWHESQCFVIECGGHRFFKEKNL